MPALDVVNPCPLRRVILLFPAVFKRKDSSTFTSVGKGMSIYAYLFNGIDMSAFSNRLFETVFDAPFIKLFILSYFIDGILIEKN